MDERQSRLAALHRQHEALDARARSVELERDKLMLAKPSHALLLAPSLA
jgi:hypothetical protein